MQTELPSWLQVLGTHPIFTPLPKPRPEFHVDFSSIGRASSSSKKDEETTTLEPDTGRRKVMCIRESDLILAVGSQIRMTSLVEAVKSSVPTRKTYKTLHTPNIQFEIHHVALNPTGKLLAIAGAFQIAVIVLPRPGYSRLVTPTVDCKSIQVGQYYHATNASPRIAKVDWHPWGEGGSTLLIMTAEGTLREYDISRDAEEPQQTIPFLPPRRTSYVADDPSAREVVSFTIGKGKSDWGPLTVYTLMRNGDLWAICPFMPTNASIPSAYIHALECFVSAKREFLSLHTSESPEDSLSTVYDYQVKYLNALMKQLPPDTVHPAISRPVSIHPPATIKNQPVRQGPFLFQPAPQELDGTGGTGDDATDLIYVGFDDENDDNPDNPLRLGVILISFKDGRVDVCLDVDKVEARWQTRSPFSKSSLPMLAVFETIDPGISSTISGSSSNPPWQILQKNNASFYPDPIYPDTVYLYHALGIHCLVMRKWLRTLSRALRETGHQAEEDAVLEQALANTDGTEVFWMLNTWSSSTNTSTPVISLTLPDDVYLPYGLISLTSNFQLVPFELSLRFESPAEKVVRPPSPPPLNLSSSSFNQTPPKDPPYTCILSTTAFTIPPVFTRPPGITPLARLSLPPLTYQPAPVTPQTLRHIAEILDKVRGEIRLLLAGKSVVLQRMEQLQIEYHRQIEHSAKMAETIERLKGPSQNQIRERMERVTDQQKALLTRMDRVLQKLMDQHSPVLSEYELKWFSELGRMKNEVLGRSDGRSLVSRAAMLSKQLQLLMPTLQQMAKDEADYKRQQAAQTQVGLGTAQALAIGKHLGEEGQLIGDAKSKLRKMASKLHVKLDETPEPT